MNDINWARIDLMANTIAEVQAHNDLNSGSYNQGEVAIRFMTLSQDLAEDCAEDELNIILCHTLGY